MDFPIWITSPNLGTFSQDHSFDLTPLLISFEAGSNSIVTLLNGSLPTGLTWSKAGNDIVITGVATPNPILIISRFTFRIRQTNGAISDRTFFLNLEPVSISPSWANQTEFLGYQGNTTIETYQLTAIPPPGEFVTYSLPSPPTGMSINNTTGLLTYNASNISIDTEVFFAVRANAATTSSTTTLEIDVVVSDPGPYWITPAGTLGTFPGNDFIEIALEAVDIEDDTITYSLTSSPVGFPLELSSTGVLYGRPDNPVSDITYSFTVQASSNNGTSSRNFSVTVAPSEQYSLLTWVTESDLGTIDEGEYIDIPIRATTQRNSLIKYAVSGGLLPPHLMIVITTGNIIGFCEYRATSKTYWFDITANDEFQSITRQFKITVRKKYVDQFFGAYIPLTSDLRDKFSADASNVSIREPGSNQFTTIQNVIDPPLMYIINGVATGFSSPDSLVNLVNPWLHNLSLQIGKTHNSEIINNQFSTIYRVVEDSQQRSNSSVFSSAVFNTNVQTDGLVYPISINNLRNAFIDDHGFVSGGGGQGAILSPIIDWSFGSLSGINVINPGSGYKGPPAITVNGSGSGAEATAILGLVSAEIIDTGQGWVVGDIATILDNIYESLAQIEITAVGTNGSAAEFRIVDPGNYQQVSANPDVTVNLGSAYMTIRPQWGVVAANVTVSGSGYQCNISFDTEGTEILPPWQIEYQPVIELGKISANIGQLAADILNNEVGSLWGTAWKPNYMVFQWQGLRWLGTTTFEDDTTTFDGQSTRFEESEDPRVTVFDNDLMSVDHNYTTFDYQDPLYYDLEQVWGSTLIDSGTTYFDLYTTIFDALLPRRNSSTIVRKWIKTLPKIYSSNNFVY